jgi:hypothetical protein
MALFVWLRMLASRVLSLSYPSPPAYVPKCNPVADNFLPLRRHPTTIDLRLLSTLVTDIETPTGGAAA